MKKIDYLMIFILFIIFIILAIIIYYIYQNLYQITNISQEFDIVIIGAGVTGAYLSNRLSTRFPNKKILVLEKNDHIGGRLLSVNHKSNSAENPLEIADEHGGMRFFPNIHPCVNKMVNELNLETVLVPFISDNNLFYARQRTFRNDNLFPETDTVYHLKEYEKNEDVGAILKENITHVFKNLGFNIDSKDMIKYKKQLYNYINLTALNFKHEVTNNGLVPISSDNWKRYLDISGYGNMFDKDEQFLCCAIEEMSLNSKSKKPSEQQHFVKHGYQQIPIKLMNNFKKISFNELSSNKTDQNNLIINNTNFYKFKESNYNKVSVYASDINTKQNFHITTKKLYICTPTDVICNIQGFSNKFTYSISKNIREFVLFKIFLHYKNNWWNELGFFGGRCTTDLNLGQLWFYNNNTLMIYAAANQGLFWSNFIPYENQIDFIPVNDQTMNMVNTLIDMLKQFFQNYNIDIPFPDSISWTYWKNGMTLWKSGNFEQSTNSIIQDLININDNIYYLNNDITLNQGWVEGCFEIVDDFIKDKYNMPGLLENNMEIV